MKHSKYISNSSSTLGPIHRLLCDYLEGATFFFNLHIFTIYTKFIVWKETENEKGENLDLKHCGENFLVFSPDFSVRTVLVGGVG